MPRNILYPQHVLFNIFRCIEFHCVCCAVSFRNVCELNTFYHFCCAFGIVAVVNCLMLITFVVDQRNFYSVKLFLAPLKVYCEFMRSRLKLLGFLILGISADVIMEAVIIDALVIISAKKICIKFSFC